MMVNGFSARSSCTDPAVSESIGIDNDARTPGDGHQLPGCASGGPAPQWPIRRAIRRSR